jgi:hypothetical protein
MFGRGLSFSKLMIASGLFIMSLFVPIGDDIEVPLEEPWDLPCSGDLYRSERPFLRRSPMMLRMANA